MVSNAKEGLEDLLALRERIHRQLIQLLQRETSALRNERELRLHARFLVNNLLESERQRFPAEPDRERFIQDVLDRALGLGVLENLLADETITEIMINGPKLLYIERAGILEPLASPFTGEHEVTALIERIVAPLGRRIDEGSPLVDARLRDSSRVNAIIPPLSLNGPCLTIRKFRRRPFRSEDLVDNGTYTAAAAQFLEAAVKGRCNILISGGTGSGKTTLLNVLAGFIPATERIVTIEDAAELQLPQEHVVRLESRPPNLEGAGEVPIRSLVKNALRMRPDRIVVGECRGGESLDMLQAMNTGHDGSLTTGHANDTREMLMRLETMVLMSGIELPVRAIREQIASALDLLVHVERAPNGRRQVTRISEVCGLEGDVITLQDVFRRPASAAGTLEPSGMPPKIREHLAEAGFELPLELFHPKAYA